MWYFICENDLRVMYITPTNHQITVGRSADLGVSDLSITDDTSISRKHAVLYASGNNLAVKDLGSKYGTYINHPFDNKIQPNTEYILQAGAIVRFGASHNVWTVNHVDFVACASTLKGENLQNLKVYVNELGGSFRNDWDETCSHLTMPAITLTIKVVMALVQGAHIVTVDFWKSCCDAIKACAKLPDPKDYLPQVVESTLNKEIVSFHPKLQRRQVFADKKVIFLSKRQLEMYKNVIEMASGVPALLSESKMTKSMLSAPNVIVIQYIINNTTQESQAIQNQIDSIVSYLKTKGKRVVADAEIGLAVLYSSADKYCNPDFNFSSEVMKGNGESQVATNPNILAQETQDTNRTIAANNKVTIDESLNSIDFDFPIKEGFTNSKRKIGEIDSETAENTAKKFASGQSGNEDENSEFFNFIQEAEGAADVNSKKLNLSRPTKRKQEQELSLEDDDLFNFIAPKEPKMNVEGSHSRMFDNGVNVKDEFESSPQVKRSKLESATNIKDFYMSMGVELKEQAVKVEGVWTTKKIKEEDITTELENEIRKIDLCKTVVEFEDLVVDRNHKPIIIKIEDRDVPNFKTFVKTAPAPRPAVLIDEDSMIEWVSGKRGDSSRAHPEDELATLMSDNRQTVST